MKKRWIYIGLLLLLTHHVKAQQDPLYSQYLFNVMVINPAYAGLNENTNISFNSRLQWSGIEGSPITNTLSANSSFFGGKSGIGMIMMVDKLGINNNTEGHLAYAYHLKGVKSALSFGLQAGFISRKFNFDELNLRVGDDPYFDPNLVAQSKLNFGAGMLYTKENLMLGVSIPRIMNNNYFEGTTDVGRYQRHYYFMGAYLLKLKSELMFKPAALVKSVPGSPISIDLNANFMYRNMYWAGVYTRNFNSYGLMGQVEFADAYRLGYSFELLSKGSTNIRALSTHEIVLSVDLALFDGQSIYQRYF